MSTWTSGAGVSRRAKRANLVLLFFTCCAAANLELHHCVGNPPNDIYCYGTGLVADFLCIAEGTTENDQYSRLAELAILIGCPLSLQDTLQVIPLPGNQPNQPPGSLWNIYNGQNNQQEMEVHIRWTATAQARAADATKMNAQQGGVGDRFARFRYASCTTITNQQAFPVKFLSWIPGYCGCRNPSSTVVSAAFTGCPNCALGTRCNSGPTVRPESCCCGRTPNGPACSCPDGLTNPLQGCRTRCNLPHVLSCNLQGTCNDGDGYSATQGKNQKFQGCTCSTSFFDWDCQQTCVDPGCSSHGTCILRNGASQPQCLCNAGYCGVACELDLVPCQFPDSSGLCSNRGICKV